MKKHLRTLFAAVAMLTPALSLAAQGTSLTVAVRGQVAPAYRRVKLPTGTFKPERYVISNGGLFPGTTRDPSCETVPSPEVAGIVARHLASQIGGVGHVAGAADAGGEVMPLVLAEVRNIRYGNMVRPGQTLRVEVTLRGQDAQGFDFQGVGTVEDQVAVQGRFRLAPLNWA